MGNVEKAIEAALKREGIEPSKLPIQLACESTAAAASEDDSSGGRRSFKSKKRKRREIEKDLRKVSGCFIFSLTFSSF